MISNFKFDFRANDPDKRLRVQAIIEKTIAESRAKINKRLFAKHLANSKKEPKLIFDSRKMRMKNSLAVRKVYYEKRDANIKKECGFDLTDESEYQAKCHHKYESNNGKWSRFLEVHICQILTLQILLMSCRGCRINWVVTHN